MTKPDFARIQALGAITNRYSRQLARIGDVEKHEVDCIKSAVEGVVTNLPTTAKGSIVVYGDPQSGKTEMMICLTARLLDEGHKVLVHLTTDSLDLLTQNLERFISVGLAPAPRSAADLSHAHVTVGQEVIVFCKKNAKDLKKLIEELKAVGPVIVIDDEADYATPNAKVNKNEKTRINQLVAELLGDKGKYIGVTATPARLNLNNTFDNRPEKWVDFPPHSAYTGQDVFFPLDGKPAYRLNQISGAGTAKDTRKALARFFVTVAYLNSTAVAAKEPEANYSILIHTSGKTDQHKVDRKVVESVMKDLRSKSGERFKKLVTLVYNEACSLYPAADPQTLTEYVVLNASRSSVTVLNSQRDRSLAGDKPTVPRVPFAVIIGGNIVSRGVTFPNLLAMYFTRDVLGRLQQDTYIQRARMFGARGKYLTHFELTIPRTLYADWHRCFVFHRLALQAIRNNDKSPVWLGDQRISIASSGSIDRGTVDIKKGEMSFQMFKANAQDVAKFDQIVNEDPRSIATLEKLADCVGDAFPKYLISYLKKSLKDEPHSLAIHTASLVRYTDQEVVSTIARKRGFIGAPQEEGPKFGEKIIHHVKIFYNDAGKARVFYKNKGGVQFVQNLKA